MKKLFYTLFTFAALNAVAQPVLTTTSQIGYVAPLAVASAATATLTPIAIVGAGATWDASALVKDASTPIVNYTVSSPAGTMYASDYPNANWYFTDPALVAVIGHSYFNLSTDSFVHWGAHTTGSAYEIYDNPEMVLSFPLAYNQVVNNTYSKTNYNAGGGVSSYQTGDVTITYDGYGTLILPNGTYNNVVRVKKVRTNNLGPTLNTYTWYNSTNGENLLMYEEKAGGTPNVVFNTNVVSGISDITTSKDIFIHSDASAKSLVIKSQLNIDAIAVYSLTGQLIYKAGNVGNNFTKINLNVNSGIYMVHVQCGNEILRSKVNF